ncbi:ferroxidase fet3 [Coemansia guatemalensis]|uniref:Ferroxidase fet3 n=1 Tax=Coemansia guatemalensis TaxID=2761395 RepID=A0A9W8LU02_9FUNG|nr:ferroxidase fet3 [Coemansia guatemalensis]
MRIAIGLFLAAATAQAKNVVENWDITYVTTNRGLNQPAKRGIGVNGQFPLPIVEAEIGDTLVLNIRNSLDTPTSLHTHGITQRGTNYYDGAPFVNECGIAPGSNFTYEIPPMQSGSYWIHGHTSLQNYDGLRTPFIIRDPNDPYHADKEYLFAVEDWWPNTFEEIFPLLTSSDPNIDLFANPPGALINGVSGNLTEPIAFEPGKTYRIRLISMMSLPLWEFAIDNHQLQVIEVDGVLTKPKTVDVVRLAPAQRVSVLVTAKSNADMNYQYHIIMFGDFLPEIAGVFPSVFNGTVVYNDQAPMFVADTIPSAFLDEISMESLNYKPAFVPDHSIYLNASSGFTQDGSNFESFNLVTYEDPLVPAIFSALTTGDMALNPITYGPRTNSHVLKYGEIVEMLLWSATDLPHPLHLHGHTFQLIERGFTNDTTGELRNIVPLTNFSPLMRDTIFVPQGEYAVVRFKADNPGVWNMHCHFDWHMGMGLNMLFIEAPEQMRQVIRVPQSVIDQCVAQGIPTSGNAAGNNAYNYDAAPDLFYLLLDNPLSE